MKQISRHVILSAIASVCVLVIVAILYIQISREDSSLYYILTVDRSLYRSDRTDAFIYSKVPTEKLIKIIENNSDAEKYPKNSIMRNLKSGKRTAALAALATRDDELAVRKLTEILTRNPNEWAALLYIGKSKNTAMVKYLCNILLKKDDAKVAYSYRDSSEIIIDTLMEVDDPSALDCFLAIRKSERVKSKEKQIDETIKRWQDIKSGKVRQTTPFAVDRTDYPFSRTLFEVSSFGGYKFTIDRDLNEYPPAKQESDIKDSFEFSKYYGFPFDSLVRLNLYITRLSDADSPIMRDVKARLMETCKENANDFARPYKPYRLETIMINGNLCTYGEVLFKNRYYFACAVMRVGDVEVYGEMKTADFYWFTRDYRELLSIFKSFTRDVDPKKKFSVFY